MLTVKRGNIARWHPHFAGMLAMRARQAAPCHRAGARQNGGSSAGAPHDDWRSAERGWDGYVDGYTAVEVAAQVPLSSDDGDTRP